MRWGYGRGGIVRAHDTRGGSGIRPASQSRWWRLLMGGGRWR